METIKCWKVTKQNPLNGVSLKRDVEVMAFDGAGDLNQQ